MERRALVSGDKTSYLGGVDIRVVDGKYVNEGRDKGYLGLTLISRRQQMSRSVAAFSRVRGIARLALGQAQASPKRFRGMKQTCTAIRACAKLGISGGRAPRMNARINTSQLSTSLARPTVVEPHIWGRSPNLRAAISR